MDPKHKSKFKESNFTRDNIIAIEKTIKEKDGEYSKKQLWKFLPIKITYKKFSDILEDFLDKRKISIDQEGKIEWIFYPKSAKDFSHLFKGKIKQSKINPLKLKKIWKM